MKKKIVEYFTNHKKEVTVKYIDPSYMIRYVYMIIMLLFIILLIYIKYIMHFLLLIQYICNKYIYNRSVPANAADALYCMILAQNAVHGAMAGYTAFTVGLVNNRVVYIPIPRIVATSPRMMDPNGRTWERILSMTRQPNPVAKLTSESYSVQDRTVI